MTRPICVSLGAAKYHDRAQRGSESISNPGSESISNPGSESISNPGSKSISNSGSESLSNSDFWRELYVDGVLQKREVGVISISAIEGGCVGQHDRF